MIEQRNLWWLTGAAAVVLLLGMTLLEPLIVAYIAGVLAVGGIILFPAYRTRGTLAIVLAAGVAAVIAAVSLLH
jgi:type II secretory pathway pseudopilin PulG